MGEPLHPRTDPLFELLEDDHKINFSCYIDQCLRDLPPTEQKKLAGNAYETRCYSYFLLYVLGNLSRGRTASASSSRSRPSQPSRGMSAGNAGSSTDVVSLDAVFLFTSWIYNDNAFLLSSHSYFKRSALPDDPRAIIEGGQRPVTAAPPRFGP